MTLSTTTEINAAHQRYLFPSVINYYAEPLPFVRGKGPHLYDAEGRQYLDFFGGILTVSVGHCDPEIAGRIKQQLDTLQHTSTLFPTAPMVELAVKLAGIAPPGLDKSFFTNSGTEADETAVLLAQVYTGRQEIVALRHAYSGRSLLAMALTAHAPWRQGPPQVSYIRHAHNAYCYRCPFKLTYPSCDLACARDLEELIQTSTGGKIAAYIAEPIQGVGGFITPPKEFFQITVDIARRYGGLFICDEVQTGFGRTGGKMFGIEHWGVKPDIMTMAKGIANGLPMGVTMARAEVADAFKGLTISTFGGNPVSSTAALATIEAIEKRRLVERTERLGARLRAGLESLKERHACVGDVRGMGLMQALELVVDRKTKEPAKAGSTRALEARPQEGLIIGKGGLHGNVLRIAPPMDIAEAEIDEGLRLLGLALAAV